MSMEEVPVRVAVRVRPLVGQEKTHNVPKCITFVPDEPQLVLGKDKSFTFDFVFPPSISQCEVYETCVEPLVTGCFQGYNATVFAYGQTGSGKTYTIGSSNTANVLYEESGIIPRALEQIFNIIEGKKGKIHFNVSASYIEIYMEEIRDLLDLETSGKDIHIREDENGNTVITGAREEAVESVDEAMSCLDAGAAGRHVGSTNMNEHSSRSHAIFTLYIEQQLIQPEEKEIDENIPAITEFMSAKFHFVDLAGSERAHRTGNVGERFKESVHINSGLLALGNVISALSDNRKRTGHIPYRDSKITRILKDSLGGNARTVMLTCLSPAAADFAENLNSLKYATRARNIKNKPIVNRDPQAAKLAEMQDEIQALREELQKTRAKTLESVSDVADATRMREAQEELERSQHEVEIVRSLVEEATSLLDDVRKTNGMTKNQINQYEHLRKRIETFNKIGRISFAHPDSAQKHQEEIVEKLKQEIEKCKNDLIADNEIFAERSKESEGLRDHIKQLEEENHDLGEQLKDVLEKLKKYDDQLLKQQVQLNKRHSPHERGDVEEREKENGTGTRDDDDSIKRMMQSFRARSDLLVGQYEEKDEVQHSISDTSDSEDDVKILKEEVGVPSKGFRKTRIRKDQTQNSAGKQRGTKAVQVASNVVALTRSNVKKRSELTKDETKTTTPDDEKIQNLRESAQVIKERVQDSEIRLREAQQQLRDLNINIKLKQELIKELVRNDKEANMMKKTFVTKVEQMEKEVEKKKKDLEQTKKTLTRYEVKSQQEQQEKQKLEEEYKRKVETLEAQLSDLRRKQKDNERVSALYNEREKKLTDIENHLERMKQQQENLQKRLKDETEKKTKMQREYQKDQQRIKELEDKNSQNEKVLRRKTEEVAAAHRKLRRKTSKEENDEANKLDERRQWLDTELENILNKKRAMQALQEELEKREAIVKEREKMMKEKNMLEIKKLRSSQVISKDILRTSTQLEIVEQNIREKDSKLKEISGDERTSETLRTNIEILKSKKSELVISREALDAKLKEGSLLSVEEERRLLEYNEGIEALDAAIEFKTDSIDAQRKTMSVEQLDVGGSTLGLKLNSLSRDDAIFLLSKYFDKVIVHRENESKHRVQCEDLAVRVNEQERVIRELERGFQQADLLAERRLTDQAKEYEQRVQFLLKQVNDLEQNTSLKDIRIHEVEKDLYYYKKVSRDLKKKLRECSGIDAALDSVQMRSVQSEAPSEPEVRQPMESKSHNNKVIDSDPKVVLQKDNRHGQTSTPVRVSRKDVRQLSEKELSDRRSTPSSRPDVMFSAATRKSSVDRLSLVQRSAKNSTGQKKSVEAKSLQDSIEQTGNPWT